MAEKSNQIKGGPRLTSEPAGTLDYSGISQESPNDRELDRAKLAQSGYTLPAEEPRVRTLAEANREADERAEEDRKAAGGPPENKSAK